MNKVYKLAVFNISILICGKRIMDGAGVREKWLREPGKGKCQVQGQEHYLDIGIRRHWPGPISGPPTMSPFLI